MKKKRLVIASLLHIITNINSAIIIPGNGTEETNFAFNVPVRAKAFDTLSGSFIVGLDKGGGDFAISIASEDIPSFTPIAQNGSLTDAAIEKISLVEVENITQSPSSELFIGTVLVKDTALEQNNVICLLNPEGTTVVLSEPLNDSGSLPSAGIISIAGATNFIFASVKAQNNDTLGNGNSGIALVTADISNTNGISFKPINAITGGAGNTAFPLSISNTSLFGGPGLTTYETNPFQNSLSTPLYWDTYFKQLYVGISCQNNNAGNPFTSVVRITVDETVGNIIAQPITPTSAIDGNNIVATAGASQILVTEKLMVMHTSTGLSYLIVQTFFPQLNTRNVYALPLVDNPTSPTHGSLADKTAPLIDGVFKTAATQPGQLSTTNDPAAQIGDPNNIPSDLQNFIGSITDIVVTGDTVYLSISGGANNQFGYVLSSQALFNANGTIARWTPWAARAVPVNAFPDINMPDTNKPHSGKVSFFAVDQTTGKVWIVEGDTGRLVGLVSWTSSFTSNSLPEVLNTYFANGCFSSLDLHHKTSLIGLNNNNYSLFGGLSTIGFARTRDEALSNTSPAGTITNFSDEKNFLLTRLTNANIPITSLEYTSGNSNNYFLAGTPAGLYVFADSVTGEGFSSADLTFLNQTPFTNGSWQLAPAHSLQKSIVSVVCAENNIYVITFDHNNSTNNYQLIAINPSGKTTIQNTFDEENIRILATSNQGIFQDIESFNSCALVHTGPENTSPTLMPEQIILATNQGMWITDASTSGSNLGTASAQDESEANWFQLNELFDQFFNGIGTIDSPVQHTAWPFYITSSSACAATCSSILTQISQSNNSTPPPPFDPLNFNTNSLAPAQVLDPIVYFWTDGARRFFIFNTPSFPRSVSKIATLPFDTTGLIINAPYFIDNEVVNQNSQFYWIRSIGDLGMILAGTNTGVISLQ